MKTRIKRISRRTVSMVLAVLLMLSILGIGSLITANAVTNPTNYGVRGSGEDYEVFTRLNDSQVGYYNRGSTTGWFKVTQGKTWDNDKTFSKYTASYNSLGYSNKIDLVDNNTNGNGNINDSYSGNHYICFVDDGTKRVWLSSSDPATDTVTVYIRNTDNASNIRLYVYSPQLYDWGNSPYILQNNVVQSGGANGWTVTELTEEGGTTVYKVEGIYNAGNIIVWNSNGQSYNMTLTNNASYNTTKNADTRNTSYTPPSTDPAITSVTPSSTSLNLGATGTITTVLTNEVSPTVTYSSSNPSVLSVTKVSNTSATVEALAPGSATITASLSDSGTSDTMTTSSITVNTPTISTFRYGASGSTDGTSNTKNHPIYVGTTSVAPTMAVNNIADGFTINYTYTIGDGTKGSVAANGAITAGSTPIASTTVSATATLTKGTISYTTASKTAYYKVYAYYLLGFKGKISNPWTCNAANMMTPDSDAGWYAITRSLAGGTTYGSGSANNNDTGFKVAYYDGTTETYYGNNNGTGSAISNSIAKSTLESSPSTWVYSEGTNNAVIRTKACDTDADYRFFFKESTKQVAVTFPTTFTLSYVMNGHGSDPGSQTVPEGSTYSEPADPSADGYNFGGWYTEAELNNLYNWSTTASTRSLYAQWTAKTSALTFDYTTNGGTGTLPSSKTATYDSAMPSIAGNLPDTRTGYTFDGIFDAQSGGTKYYNADGTSARNWDKNTEDGTTLYAQWTAKTSALTFDYTTNGGSGTLPSSKTATYGTAMPDITGFLPNARTGYTFLGIFDAESGGTKYYNADGSSARNWDKDKTSGTTLYAQWSEDTGTVAVKAFTGGNEDTTGGTVSPATVTVGIDTSLSATATPETDYVFTGWTIAGARAAEVELYTDAECTTPYSSGDRTHTTVYIKTTGATGLNTTNAIVKANFVYGARTYVVGTMVKDDMGNYTTAKASAVANTGDGFNATTTIANSGSVVLYGNASMSTTGNINGTDTQNPTVNFTGATNNGGSYEFTYVKYQFMGWKKSDTAITEVSGDNTSWDETDASISPEVPASGEGYWYACYRKQYVFCAFRSYDYMAGAGGQIIFIASHPTKYQIGSADATGYTEQGKKIVVPAGEQLKLTYTSLASSDCIDHVYYDDTDYTTATPTAENFDTSNQHEITTGISTDQSAHEVTINMTQNYKNIHIALGSKYKVFFSDEKNAIIHSKNVDNYYAPGEAMSGATEAKYLTVKAAGNASQTNSIISSNVKFYYCNSTGEYTDASGNLVDTPVEITGTDLAFEDGDSTSSGETDGTARKITGTMPNTNVYVDLGLATTYDFHLGTRMVSDSSTNGYETWAKVADTVATYKTYEWHDTDWNTATQNLVSWNSGAITAVDKGDSVTLSWTYWEPAPSNNNQDFSSTYMFLGWYKGDASGPDYSKKGLISEKTTISYTPRGNVYVYALGTRDMFINGTMSITGASAEVGNWPSTNFKMSFDPDYVNPEDSSKRGRYYWEITEDMLNATSDPGKLTGLHNDSSGVWIPNGLGGQNTAGWNRAESNSYFRIYDSSTITDSDSDSNYWDETANLSYWTGIDKQNNNNSDLNWGKALDGDSGGDTRKTLGLGYINYNPTSYPAYSAPIRIYAYPGHGINVEATPVYSNLYISNGFDVGATSKDTAVSVTASGGDSFTITTVDTYTGRNEGTVTHYKPEKKNATVRIQKTCSATEKVSAFFVYDLDNDTVYSLKDVQNSSNDWYIDLTVKLQQNLYIVPIIEETSANVTVNFDATQLNKTQWGDIVSCYAWYGSGSALGAFPGQPMIVSDDLGSWTAKFPDTKTVGGTKYNLRGITFSNYVDGDQSWLGRTSTTGRKPVMSTVTYSNTSVSGGVGSIESVADDGLIKQYNKITSGTKNEYSRQNFKAQTYDYREPIAIYKNSGKAEGVETTITFAMKDGDSSLLSWRHTELLNNNIINLPEGWTKLNWEYLTDSTGNKYADLNGRAMDTKPTATYYVAAKGGYVYKDGDVTAAFYSGKSYDTADHSYVNVDYYNTVGNVYNEDGKPVKSYADDGTPTYASDNNYGWTHNGECPEEVTYGDATNTSADPADIDFDYAVQWYVYDASGNYITTVLSSALADMNTAKTETYIARELTNLGYAVDGKAVAMCYDKPRYYYWDSAEVTNGANKGSGAGKVNSGEGFAGYRFTGQWYTTVETEPVTVNVRVGMMTDSGEVVSDSNVAGYGSASAVYSTANNIATYASQITSDGTKSVTIALADAEKRIVKLDATDTNFIGWYYYDTNTDEFTKASYGSNSNFFPNFKKDVTYYAMYKAAATYNYKYNGREKENGTYEKTYSVSGGDLTAEEMGAGNIISLDSLVDGVARSTDLVTKAPIGKIGVFKRTLDFSQAPEGQSISYNNGTEYFMTASNFKNEADTYTLTAHYVDSAGQNRTMAVNAVYNGQAVELLDNSGVPIGKQWTGHKFVGWYSYDGSTYGELLSAHPKYGLRLTRNQDIIAVYENDGSGKTLPTVADVWHAYIDENTVTKEMYGETSGRYYNDTIVRVRNDLDVNTPLPDGAEVGVIMINDNGSGDDTTNRSATLTTYANGLTSGQTGKIRNTNLTVTKVSTNNVTSFNRVDLAIRGDYAKMKGSAYTIYSYIKVGETYTFSTGTTKTDAYTV